MWSHRILAACFHEINPLLDLDKQAANNDPEKQADHQPCRVMWMDHASIWLGDGQWPGSRDYIGTWWISGPWKSDLCGSSERGQRSGVCVAISLTKLMGSNFLINMPPSHGQHFWGKPEYNAPGCSWGQTYTTVSSQQVRQFGLVEVNRSKGFQAWQGCEMMWISNVV